VRSHPFGSLGDIRNRVSSQHDDAHSSSLDWPSAPSGED
jgi:hypothetical protein